MTNVIKQKMDHDLERDLNRTDWIRAKAIERKSYAQNLYAALCNNEFQRNDIMPILKDQTWSCTWRYAGGIVADLRAEGGEYLDWYCSGMIQGHPKDDPDPDPNKDYVPEGTVTEEIRGDLHRLGWTVLLDQ